MLGAKIEEINQRLPELRQELLSDTLTRQRVEIAIQTFGGFANIVQPFVPPQEMDLPPLNAVGGTPLGEAVIQALEAIKRRQAEFKRLEVDSYRPITVFCTDGEPTDSVDTLQEAARQLRAVEKAMRHADRIACFPVAVGMVDSRALEALFVRPPLELSNLNFGGLFRWLAASLRTVSASQVGVEVILPNPLDFWTRM